MMIPRAPALFVGAAMFFAACSAGDPDAGASATHPLLRTGKCGSCRIVAETVAVMGDDADTVAIAKGGVPVRDSRGRFYLIDDSRSHVLVFTPDGRYLTTFGRPGSGPGEFRGVSDIHVAEGDTLLVLSWTAVHVISPEYTHVRQSPPHQQRGDVGFFNTILSDGRILRLEGENTFDILSRDGVVSPVVQLPALDTARCEECGLRTFREGIPAGTIWSGTQNRYRIEQFDLSGKFIRGFTRKVNWFPAWNTDPERDNVTPLEELQKSRLFGVRQTADSLVWTHVMVIDNPDFVPKLPDASSPGGVTPGDINRVVSDVMSNYVTMIEVIDPASGEVLATRELKMIAVPMLGDLIAKISIDEHGDWSCVVLRLKLEGREPGTADR